LNLQQSSSLEQKAKRKQLKVCQMQKNIASLVDVYVERERISMKVAQW